MLWVGAVCIGVALAALVIAFWPEEAPTSSLLDDENRRYPTRPSRPGLGEAAGSALGRQARRFTTAGIVESMERSISLAGLGERWTVERVLVLRLGLVVVAVAVGIARFLADPGGSLLLQGIGSAAVCYLLPDAMLQRRARAHQDSLERQLPSIIDQIAISVEVGASFEHAIRRAATAGRSELARELRTVVRDLQLGVSMDQALAAMAKRNDSPSLRRFVQTIRQATAHGLPLSNVLRIQAEETRVRRAQAAEEQAMKIPVKIVFPLVLFILPALFILILGPAALSLRGF